MPVKEVVSEHKLKMEKSIEYLHTELKGIRTGRASTALVENLKVNYYGNPTPLKQLANLAAPESDMIVIKPFDPGSIGEIEKAIKSSDLSLAPIVEKKLIRLNVPPLTEERREQIVHQVKQLGEQAKISIRNIRRDANKQLENEEKDKSLSEDEMNAGKKQIDDITKAYNEKIEDEVKKKADEIMLE